MRNERLEQIVADHKIMSISHRSLQFILVACVNSINIMVYGEGDCKKITKYFINFCFRQHKKTPCHHRSKWGWRTRQGGYGAEGDDRQVPDL